MNPSSGLLALLLMGLIVCSAAVFATPALMVDGDADRVSDERDECPYSAPGERVNAVGCGQTGDADGDQVGDVADMCPFTSPGATVDAEGCAMDDDFDGIANGIDQCPKTLLGERVDSRGCEPGATVLAKKAPSAKASTKSAAAAPALQAAVVAPSPGSSDLLEPLAEVGFDRNSAKLSPAATARIQEVVRAAAPKLTRSPSMLLRVSARHTNREKTALQAQRGEALRNALIAAGVAPAQIRINTTPTSRRDATGRWAGLQLWTQR